VCQKPRRRWPLRHELLVTLEYMALSKDIIKKDDG